MLGRYASSSGAPFLWFMSAQGAAGLREHTGSQTLAPSTVTPTRTVVGAATERRDGLEKLLSPRRVAPSGGHTHPLAVYYTHTVGIERSHCHGQRLVTGRSGWEGPKPPSRAGSQGQVLARLLTLEKHLHLQRQCFANTPRAPAVPDAVEDANARDTSKEFTVHRAGVLTPLGGLILRPLTSEVHV